MAPGFPSLSLYIFMVLLRDRCPVWPSGVGIPTAYSVISSSPTYCILHTETPLALDWLFRFNLVRTILFTSFERGHKLIK